MSTVTRTLRSKRWTAAAVVALLAAMLLAGTASVSAAALDRGGRGHRGGDCLKGLMAGNRVATTLDQLVTDGTITAEQRTAIVDRLGQNATAGEKACAGMALIRSAGVGDAVGKLLGMDRKEIAQAWRDGQSLSEMAAAKGVDRNTLVTTIMDAFAARLDQAVTKGRITADRKAELMATIQTRVEAGVDRHIGDLRPGQNATPAATASA